MLRGVKSGLGRAAGGKGPTTACVLLVLRGVKSGLRRAAGGKGPSSVSVRSFLCAQATACDACPTGRVSMAQATVCTTCAQGAFAKLDNLSRATECVVCAAGTFSGNTSWSACRVCAAGRISAESWVVIRDQEGGSHARERSCEKKPLTCNRSVSSVCAYSRQFAPSLPPPAPVP